MAKNEPTMKGWKEFAEFDEIFAMPPVPDTLIQLEGASYREVIVNMWTDARINDVKATMADVDKRYNQALSKLDPSLLALYSLADGVTATKSK